MNTTYMNTTSKCPDFLEAPPNVTFPTCALGSCANNSAVMAKCCTDTPIIPYYYDSGFPGAKNETSGWGSYCQMKDNVSAAVWENCASFNGANRGMCGPFDVKTSAGGVSSEVGGLMGLMGLVMLMRVML